MRERVNAAFQESIVIDLRFSPDGMALPLVNGLDHRWVIALKKSPRLTRQAAKELTQEIAHVCKTAWICVS
jgi:hypothetical protein